MADVVTPILFLPSPHLSLICNGDKHGALLPIATIIDVAQTIAVSVASCIGTLRVVV